jgi:hypothetical protein
MRTMTLPCVVGLLLGAAPVAHAQLGGFSWTVANHGLDVLATSETLSFTTPFGVQAGAAASITTTAPVAGHVSVHADFWVEEHVCNSSLAFRITGHVVTSFSNCFFGDELEFDVPAGETFGFAMKCNNPSWWASLLVSDLVFTPYWSALGGGLAGVAGTPALSGDGILQPGQLVELQLASAAPAAPTVLVAGFGEVNVPFKGGLLVPSPDLLVHGLITSAAGGLQLTSPWPAGVPAGTSIVMQAWIADVAGPQGWSASNAAQGAVL